MFRGGTSSGSWRRAASVSRSFFAALASACTIFLAAEAAALSASAFARRSASSSRASRAFRYCASRRSAAGSNRRLVVEVSADLMTEAAANFSRVRGPEISGQDKKFFRPDRRRDGSVRRVLTLTP